jgi:hypothetical protein
MGESEVVKKLWESNPSDKWKLVILAKLHEVKMQAEICQDHPVSNQNEEAHTATEVSMCLIFYFSLGGTKRMTFLELHSFVSPYFSDDLQKIFHTSCDIFF